ncbi:putative uncharacterized protein [Corallococcus sp. CAG:1435]|nr:putative uncharacterized protein [Corallococcus sp. CAG:1435]
MTEKIQAISMCLTFPDVYEDYPFDLNWTAIRHRSNRKTFAFVYRRNNALFINVKVLPELGAVWRQQYPQSVTQGYHMNKLHWVTVALDGKLPDSVILRLLTDSYNLTKSK